MHVAESGRCAGHHKKPLLVLVLVSSAAEVDKLCVEEKEGDGVFLGSRRLIPQGKGDSGISGVVHGPVGYICKIHT